MSTPDPEAMKRYQKGLDLLKSLSLAGHAGYEKLYDPEKDRSGRPVPPTYDFGKNRRKSRSGGSGQSGTSCV